MEQESTTPENSKKRILVVSLFIILAVVLVTVLISLKKDNTIPQLKENTELGVETKKVYTQTEKMQMLERLVLLVPKDNRSPSEKARALESLEKQIPVDTTSHEEKLRRLRALEASNSLIN